MRRYETIFILRPSLAENEINNVVDNTLKIISDDGGSIIQLDRWGMRKLAYLIKKEKQGFYVFMDYAAPSESVIEMERKFRIDDSVLKYMTVKIADSISEEEIVAAKGEAEEKKAAAKAAEEAALAENVGETDEKTTDSAKDVETKEKSTDKKETEEKSGEE